MPASGAAGAAGFEGHAQSVANDTTNTIVIRDTLVRDASLFSLALRHEIVHAVDDLLSQDKGLGEAWKAYRTKLFDDARRNGEQPFTARSIPELLARKLGH